jgi:hypothetical protein
MIENREKEWQELHTKATQMLENPRLLPKDETNKLFIPILHLWISPTFTNEKHWVFYKPQTQINPPPKPFVQQLIWRKDADFQRLNNPLIGLQEGFHIEPTFEIKTVEIENEIYQKFYESLAKIELPAFIKEEVFGLDGENFGIETLGFYHNAKITWWSAFPKEWQNLVEWFEKIRKFLEENFNDR